MAEDRDQDAPSLEPPSLFGRKKKRPEPPASASPSDEGAVTAPTETEPVAEPVPAVAEPVAEPVPAVAEPVAEPAPPVAQPEPVPEPVAEPVAVPPQDSPTTVLDADEPTTVLPAPTPAPIEREAASEPPEPEEPREPWLTGRPAAVLTGLLVGALIVAATAGSLRLCTAVKGTSSCGGPGFFLLVAILVVAVLLGAALLRAAHVPQPGSTSFLAVGLLSVVALLFLVGQLFQWWMIIVIPLVSVATFLLSHWVTTTYIDPSNDGRGPDEPPEAHDIR